MKYTTSDDARIKVVRIYLLVSTDEQDLTRTNEIEQCADGDGSHNGLYGKKLSGAREDRPELLHMIVDLQPVEVVTDKVDSISLLPLPEAEQLVASIQTKDAKLGVPGLVDLLDFTAGTGNVAWIILEAVRQLLLKLALQMTRDDMKLARKTALRNSACQSGAGGMPAALPT